jgi:hypothetical protein
MLGQQSTNINPWRRSKRMAASAALTAGDFFHRSGTVKEPDLHPALSGDEVYTPSPRRSEG